MDSLTLIDRYGAGVSNVFSQGIVLTYWCLIGQVLADAAKQASRSSVQAQADVPKKRKLPDEVIVMEPGASVRRRLEQMSMVEDGDGAVKKSWILHGVWLFF